MIILVELASTLKRSTCKRNINELHQYKKIIVIYIDIRTKL